MIFATELLKTYTVTCRIAAVVESRILTAVQPVESLNLLAPTNLQSKILSTTTVWLQWTDPSIGSHQSAHDSRYYNVHYQAIQPFGKALSAVARDLHVILYNLAPATRYEFKVRTVKGTQTSPYSDTVTNRTYETGYTHTFPLPLIVISYHY